MASPRSVWLAGGPGRTFCKDQGGEASAHAKPQAHSVFLWETRLPDHRVEAKPNNLNGNRIPRNSSGGKCVRCSDKQV